MTDAPVPTPPADREPTAELIAEVEKALSAGQTDDQLATAAEALHAVWHALFISSLHEVWWPAVLAKMDAVGDEAGYLAYVDWLSDWVTDATEATKAWLVAHEIPGVQVWFQSSVGTWLIAQVKGTGVPG